MWCPLIIKQRVRENRRIESDLFGRIHRGMTMERLASQPVRKPSPDAQRDQGWVAAGESNNWRGNVLVLRDLDTGPLGMIHYRLIKKRRPKVDAAGRRIDIAHYAVQLRLP
jgi:hypothetical protein